MILPSFLIPTLLPSNNAADFQHDIFAFHVLCRFQLCKHESTIVSLIFSMTLTYFTAFKLNQTNWPTQFNVRLPL
jgi:hypothetical protein